MTCSAARNAGKLHPAYLCKNAVTGGRQVAVEAWLIVVETWLLAIAGGGGMGVK